MRNQKNKPGAGWSDEELVRRCVAGEAEAWDALVERYKNLVYSVPLKYRLSPEDCADVFQSVFAELMAEIPRLRHPAGLRSWLVTVASHKCLRLKRRMARQVSSDGTSTPMEAVEPHDMELWLQQVQRAEQLNAACEKLPPRCREMIRLLFWQDPPPPYSEVAARFGLAEGSIGFIRGRCLTKLRKLLEEAENE